MPDRWVHWGATLGFFLDFDPNQIGRDFRHISFTCQGSNQSNLVSLGLAYVGKGSRSYPLGARTPF